MGKKRSKLIDWQKENAPKPPETGKEIGEAFAKNKKSPRPTIRSSHRG